MDDHTDFVSEGRWFVVLLLVAVVLVVGLMLPAISKEIFAIRNQVVLQATPIPDTNLSYTKFVMGGHNCYEVMSQTDMSIWCEPEKVGR